MNALNNVQAYREKNQLSVRIVDRRDFATLEAANDYIDYRVGGGDICRRTLLADRYVVETMEVVK